MPFKLSKSMMIAGGVAIAGLLVLIIGLGMFNGMRDEGIVMEENLQKTYNGAQNELSNHINTVKEQLGVADIKSDKLDATFGEILRGRGEMTGRGENSAVLLLVEAYPQLGDLNSYDKILDTVAAGRTAFKNDLDRLIDEIGEYEIWLEKGWPRSSFVSMAGFPSSRLEARVGDTILTGDAALAKMKQIPIASQATQSFDEGEDNGIDFSDN